MSYKMDISKGFVILPRCIMTNPALNTFERLGWFIDLLMMASYKPREIFVHGQRYTLQEGELYATNVWLAEHWNKSRPTVIKFLNELETLYTLKRKTLYTSLSIITICNYEIYKGIFDTSLYTSFYTSLDTNRNKYINKLNNNDDDTRASEEITPEMVISETFKSTALLEQFCMTEGLTTEQCQNYAAAVVNEWRMTGVEHNNATDARKHLLSAIRIKARAERSRPAVQKTKEQAAAEAFNAAMTRIANSIKNGTNN